MQIVTITLGSKDFKLSCPQENQKELEIIAEKLDHVIEDKKQNNPSASFELILVMTALDLMYKKLSKEKESAGNLLKNANIDFQKLLSSIDGELKIVAEKFQN